jgi:hypothetical protein
VSRVLPNEIPRLAFNATDSVRNGRCTSAERRAIPCPVSFRRPCVRTDDGDHRPGATQSLVQSRTAAPTGSVAYPSGVTGAFYSRDSTPQTTSSACTETLRYRQSHDSAARHRKLSRATIMKLANSLAPEDPLRATFLSPPSIRRVLNSDAVSAQSAKPPRP